MDAPRILLVLSLAMLLQMVAAALSYETARSAPQEHQTVAEMEIGGERAVEDAEHWGFGLVFGITTILSLVATLFLATGQARYAVQRKLAIFVGAAAYLAVFVVMMLRYRDYTEQGPTLLGPLATPTTWMVFGLWGVPAIFVLIYCVKFDTWFGDDETQSEGKLD